MNPVTNSDIGTYTISVTSTIGSCTNTTSKSYTLSYCLALPETLLRFNGQWNTGNIKLNWQTADEINLSQYVVERSTDGYTFTPVQQVQAVGGPMNNYTATDMNVPDGIVYYRLQIVEKNGFVNYSGIISFNKKHTQSYNVYPSLITGNTRVMITCPFTNTNTAVQVIGIDGRIWQTSSIPAGTTASSIDVANLATGCYLIVFSNNGKTVTTKIWKQ